MEIKHNNNKKGNFILSIKIKICHIYVIYNEQKKRKHKSIYELLCVLEVKIKY